MKTEFIDRSDLDDHGFVRPRWFTDMGFSGILFPDRPATTEFHEFFELVGEQPSDITVFYAEFEKDFLQTKFEELLIAYKFIQSVLYREVFVRFSFSRQAFIVWIPQEHDFYGIFGPTEDIRHLYEGQINDLKAKFDTFFADEDFFGPAMRAHIETVKAKYFTA